MGASAIEDAVLGTTSAVRRLSARFAKPSY